jgi:hypothetical protein
LIKLPENKFIAWTEAIEKILKDGTAMAKVLNRNICRLIQTIS